MRFSPRVTAPDTSHISLRTDSYNFPLISLVVGGLLLVCVIGSILVDTIALRLFTVSGALIAATALNVVWSFHNAAVDHAIRVESSHPGLRFVPSAGIHLSYLLLTLAGLLPGTVQVLIILSTEFTRNAVGPIFVSLIALFALGQQIWSLRTPPGLTLTEQGIRGVRGTKPVDLRWDDLARAEVVASKGAKLVLHPRRGPAVVIDPRWTGSDPNLVAPIINHFLTHPEHRQTLTDPRAAIRLVEEATRTS